MLRYVTLYDTVNVDIFACTNFRDFVKMDYFHGTNFRDFNVQEIEVEIMYQWLVVKTQ